MEFKASSFSMKKLDDSDNTSEFYDVKDATITSWIEPSSMANETLTFNHEATFSAEIEDVSPLFSYTTDLNDKPLYIEYNVPILVQARWHKKPRINKKWLKRYGMKEDSVLVRCYVESINSSNEKDSYYITDHIEIGMTLSGIEYKFRPDQLRRNLKIEVM